MVIRKNLDIQAKISKGGLELSSKLTNCKVCGAQIASNAKNCPQCGAKNKKPLLKKIWVWLLIVVVVCWGLSALSSDTGSNTKTDSVASESQNEVGNKLSKYQWISENADTTFTIADNAKNFINEHENLFPVNQGSESDANAFIDNTVTYAHLSKNISKYGSSLMSISGYVIDIQEAEDGSMSYVHILDIEGNSYILYYLGVLDNVFEETEVSACILPLSMITFQNMNAQYTEAVACAACFVNPIA